MQTTSQTWKTLWAAGNAAVEARATINGVVYTDIAPQITRAAMQQGLSVGNVVSACCAVAIRTTNAIPRSAAVAVEMRLNDGTTQSEWLPAGTFYISRRSRDPITGILTLECYDALLKANAVLSDLPWTTDSGEVMTDGAGNWIYFNAAFPLDMQTAAHDIALMIGAQLDSRTSIGTGAAYVIESAPEGTTMRDVLGMIAAANGGNWIITPAGKLRLVPIMDAADAAEATDDAQDITAVLGSVYMGDAATISGVRYTSGDALPVLIGDDSGVIVDVTMSAALAQDVATQLTGQTVQPYALAQAIYDPAAEIGDYIRYGALAGVLYSETVTLGAAVRGDLSAPDPAELADEYPYPGASDKALTQAKAYTVETVAALNESLDQEGVFNRLTNNGADQGVILYDGKIYINAEYIQTGYLSASRIKGGELTLGGSGNTNGTIDVKDAQGNTIGWWNRQGLGVIAGGGLTIGSYSDGSRIRTLSVVPTWDENRRVARLLFEGYADNQEEYVVDISPGFLSVSRQEYDPDDESYSDKYEMKFDAYTGRLIMSVDGHSKLYLDLANLRFQWSGDVVINGNYGVSGTFTTADNKHVTVTNGIITRIY